MSILETKTNHYYHIRSKDREFGDEVKFEVKPHRFNKVRSFKIKETQLTYSFFPINSNNNNIVIRKNGDTEDRTATLTPGEYNLSEFKTELKNKLDLLGGPAQTYTITDSTTTHKLTITQDSSTFIYKGTLSTGNKLLGFNNIDTGNLVSHTAPNIINISGTNYVEVYSNELTKYDTRVRNSENSGNNLLFIIPLSNYSFGEIILYKPDLIFDYHPKSEGNIDIELRDEDGNILGGSNKLNGQNFTILLQFHSLSSNNPHTYNRMNYKRNLHTSKNF